MSAQAVSNTRIAGFEAIRSEGRADRSLLLFAHGAFVAHEPFIPWMTVLAGLGWRGVAAARRGRKGVGPDNAAGLCIADYVEDTRRVIDALGEVPIIVGHSLGGLIAQRLGELGLAKGLVLVSPAPPGRLPPQPVALPTYLPMMPKILAGKPVLPGAGGCATIALNRVPEGERGRIHARLIPESGRAYREMIFGTFKVDAAKVRCPVMVVVGSDDRIVAPSLARATGERYGAEFRQYDGHAHWILEEPGFERVASDVGDWLARTFPPVARPLAGAACSRLAARALVESAGRSAAASKPSARVDPPAP